MDWMRSPKVLIAIAILSSLLILADSFAIYRAVKGNPYPYWKTNIDFAGYIEASKGVLLGKNIYEYTPCPCNLLYGTTEIHDQYPYPPFFAELLIPIVLLGDVSARYIWLLASAACVVGAIVLLLRGFDYKISWPWIMLVIGVVGASHIIRNDLYHGQVNLLLVFLITLGLYLATQERKVLAGIVLGIPIVIKPFLGVLFLYFLWRREWKTAGSIALTSGGLLILSFTPLILSIGFPAVQNWMEISAYYSSHAIAARPDNYSFNGLLLRLFSANFFTKPLLESNMLLNVLSIGIIGASLVTFVLAAPAKRRASSHGPVAPSLVLGEVGLLMSLSMMFGPMTEQDHLLMLAPGLVGVIFLVSHYQHTPSTYRKLWYGVATVWVCFFALLLAPIPIRYGLPASNEWVRLEGLTILLTGRIALMLLILTSFLAIALWKQQRKAWITSGSQLHQA
jgi:hypothetical protein